MGWDANDAINENREIAAATAQEALNKARSRKAQKDNIVYISKAELVPGMEVRDAKSTSNMAVINSEAEKKELLALRRNIDTSIVLPPIDMIGGLFPREHVSTAIAAPGTGKTWFVQKLTSDLSIGGNVFEGYVESDPLRVMIFAGEAGYELLIRRGTETGWQLNKDNISVFSGNEAEQKKIMLDVDNQDGQKNVEMLIGEFKPDLVFIDTLGAFHSSDENSSKEMRPIFRYLCSLAKDKNIALVAIHHTRKRKIVERKARMTQDEAVGSSILNRFSAVILGLEEAEKSETPRDNPTILVWTQKSWYRKPGPFTFKMEKDTYGRLGMTVNLQPDIGGKAREQIFVNIQTRYKPGEWFNACDIVDLMDNRIGDTYIRRCLNELVDRKTLIKEGSNRWTKFAISEE